MIKISEKYKTASGETIEIMSISGEKNAEIEIKLSSGKIFLTNKKSLLQDIKFMKKIK